MRWGNICKLFFFHFLAEDDHAMPAYLDRVPFVLYQLILFGSEIQHYIYGFHFAFNRSSPSTEIWNGICSRQSCKEIPRNRYSRPKDLGDVQDQRILKMKIVRSMACARNLTENRGAVEVASRKLSSSIGRESASTCQRPHPIVLRLSFCCSISSLLRRGLVESWVG